MIFFLSKPKATNYIILSNIQSQKHRTSLDTVQARHRHPSRGGSLAHQVASLMVGCTAPVRGQYAFASHRRSSCISPASSTPRNQVREVSRPPSLRPCSHPALLDARRPPTASPEPLSTTQSRDCATSVERYLVADILQHRTCITWWPFLMWTKVSWLLQFLSTCYKGKPLRINSARFIQSRFPSWHCHPCWSNGWWLTGV